MQTLWSLQLASFLEITLTSCFLFLFRFALVFISSTLYSSSESLGDGEGILGIPIDTRDLARENATANITMKKEKEIPCINNLF